MQSPPPGFGAVPKLASLLELAGKGKDVNSSVLPLSTFPSSVDYQQVKGAAERGSNLQASALQDQNAADLKEKAKSRPPTPPAIAAEQAGRGGGGGGGGGSRRVIRHANEEVRHVPATSKIARGPDGTRGFKYGRGKPLPPPGKAEEGPVLGGFHTPGFTTVGQIEKLQEELALAAGESERWKLEATDASGEIARLNHELFAARFEADRLRNEVQEGQVAGGGEKEVAQDKEVELVKVQEELHEARTEIGRLQHELFEAKFETERLKSERPEDEKVEWQGRSQRLEASPVQGDQDMLRQQVQELERGLTSDSEKIAEAQSELLHAQAFVEQLLQENADKEAKVAALMAENVGLKATAEAGLLTQGQIKEEGEDLQKKLVEAEAEIQRMREQLHKAREEIGSRSRHVGIRKGHSGKQEEDGKVPGRGAMDTADLEESGVEVGYGGDGGKDFLEEGREVNGIDTVVTGVAHLGLEEMDEAGVRREEQKLQPGGELNDGQSFDVKVRKELEFRVQQAEGVANLLMHELQEARKAAAAYAQTIKELQGHLAKQAAVFRDHLQREETAQWAAGAHPADLGPSHRLQVAPVSREVAATLPHGWHLKSDAEAVSNQHHHAHGSRSLTVEHLHAETVAQQSVHQHSHWARDQQAYPNAGRSPLDALAGRAAGQFPDHRAHDLLSEIGPSAPPFPGNMQGHHMPGVASGQAQIVKPGLGLPPGLVGRRPSPPPSPPFDTRSGSHAYAPSAPPVPLTQHLPSPFGPSRSQHSYGPSAPPHYLMKNHGARQAQGPPAHFKGHGPGSESSGAPIESFFDNLQGSSNRRPISPLDNIFHASRSAQGNIPRGPVSLPAFFQKPNAPSSHSLQSNLIPTSVLLSSAASDRGYPGGGLHREPQAALGDLGSQDPAIVSLGVGMGMERLSQVNGGAGLPSSVGYHQGVSPYNEDNWVDEVIVFKGR